MTFGVVSKPTCHLFCPVSCTGSFPCIVLASSVFNNFNKIFKDTFFILGFLASNCDDCDNLTNLTDSTKNTKKGQLGLVTPEKTWVPFWIQFLYFNLNGLPFLTSWLLCSVMWPCLALALEFGSLTSELGGIQVIFQCGLWQTCENLTIPIPKCLQSEDWEGLLIVQCQFDSAFLPTTYSEQRRRGR